MYHYRELARVHTAAGVDSQQDSRQWVVEQTERGRSVVRRHHREAAQCRSDMMTAAHQLGTTCRGSRHLDQWFL